MNSQQNANQPAQEAGNAAPDADLYEPVYAFVRQVPEGKVVTYGQVAACLTQVSLTPHEVGVAMRYAPPDVPWQRVVGAGGKLPINKRSPDAALRQQRLLEGEGVPFLPDSERIDMRSAQWQPAEPRSPQGDLFEEAE
jgi:methylated-DNA-protein-cysteine methyltransferase-like protein